MRKWAGRRQRPPQALCQNPGLTAACQPPDTPLKTLSVFLHKVALKVRKINLVCLGANLGPTLRAP